MTTTAISQALNALLAAQTRATLKETWHALEPHERDQLRTNQQLADHAWSVLKRAPR
jgi:hypothetical protein